MDPLSPPYQREMADYFASLQVPVRTTRCAKVNGCPQTSIGRMRLSLTASWDKPAMARC
jgi:hypothetical protein